ncbi:MAG: hypothetical protein FWH02_07810, partial [Oscillospiraceae bacterium]|nr:hypothetical protein [Oscillospiraceae bacterium]
MAIGGEGLCIGCMAPMEHDGTCAVCGYDNERPNPGHYLQPGSVVGGRFAVGALKSFNSEGATYIGYDGQTDRPVWIREYFPHAICDRVYGSNSITPASGYGAQYKAIMAELVDLCNAIKRLSVSDSVIPIESVFSDNNTLYAVYRYLNTITLEEYLIQKGGSIGLDEALRMFVPLCDTMGNMHARGDLHRGISPHTIYVDKAGRAYLWGFCQAATRTGGSELDAELFSGYSAPEQYVSNGWQGPWTDVYAMAAVFYRAVSGFVPPKSTMVGSQRVVAPLSGLADGISEEISIAVADAMGIAAGGRTQTMAGFARQLIPPGGRNNHGDTAVYDVDSVNNNAKQERAARSGQNSNPSGGRGQNRGKNR